MPYLFYKDASTRGRWLTYGTSAVDLGIFTPLLSSGENFVIVHSGNNYNAYPNTIYTFNGSGFSSSTISGASSSGFAYLTATNNYFFKLFAPNPQMTFSYLNEEKNWFSSSFPSAIQFSYANGNYYSPTYFYASYSFVMTMRVHMIEH